MKFPSELKIGAHEVKVVFADSWPDSGADMGCWDDASSTIFIRDNLSDTLKFATLIHEAMHVMNATLDHALLDSLSEQLAQVLLDNGLIDEE